MTTQCGDDFKLQNEPFGVYAVSGDIFVPKNLCCIQYGWIHHVGGVTGQFIDIMMMFCF